MEKQEWLPIGSVIRVKGNVKKMMIIARAVVTQINGKQLFFDYGACLYPEGMIGDSIVFFNGKDIQAVLDRGYSDDDDAVCVENIAEYMQRETPVYGDPYELNKENGIE